MRTQPEGTVNRSPLMDRPGTFNTYVETRMTHTSMQA